LFAIAGRVGWFVVLATLGCGRPGGFTAPPSPAAARNMDNRWVESAGNLVHRVADFHHVGVRFARVQVLETHETGDSTPPSTHTMEMWVRRPDQIAARSADGSRPDLISNRDERYTVFRTESRYIQEKSSRTIDDLSDDPAVLSAHGWGVMFGAVLFCEVPFEAIMVGVDVLQYVGQEPVDDVMAHRVRFEQADMTWNMWIAVEGEPRVLKLEFDRLPGGDRTDAPVKATVIYRSWEFNANIPPETFEFHPPAGFTRIPPTAAEKP
jgi:hypothetical protein